MEYKRVYNDPVDENDIANKRYVDKSLKTDIDYADIKNKPTIPDVNNLGSIVVDDISCKNLFNIQNPDPYNSIVTSMSSNSITFNNNGAYAQLKYHFTLKKNTNYVLKYTLETTNPSFIPWVSIQGNNYWGNEITGRNGTGIFVIPFNSGDWDTVDMVFPINGDTNLTNTGTLSNVQLEEGTVATGYTPYKSLGYTSGSNENGSWVKYDDGRMECWGVKSYNNVEVKVLDITEYYGALPAQPFPQAFVRPPICVMSIDNVQPGYALELKSTGNGATETHTPMTLAFCAVSATATRIDVHYHAIGRWK